MALDLGDPVEFIGWSVWWRAHPEPWARYVWGFFDEADADAELATLCEHYQGMLGRSDIEFEVRPPP